MPFVYVLIQLFIAYAVIVSVVTDEDNLSEWTNIFFTMYFTFFLVLGQMFTVSIWATIPMTEKKGGLR